MKKDAAKLLARAEECLEEAQQLLDFDHHLGAMNRAYIAYLVVSVHSYMKTEFMPKHTKECKPSSTNYLSKQG